MEKFYNGADNVKKGFFILLIVSVSLNIFLLIRLSNANKVIVATEALLQEQQARITEFISKEDQDTYQEELVIIHLSGAVNSPGVYSFTQPIRLFELIEKAGGEQDSADLSALNLASIIYDGSKIHIPAQGEAAVQVVSPANSGTVNQKNALVNINTATMEQLEALDGIGKVKAKDIITYRQENGSFKKVEDIMRVKGIGPSTYDKIRSVIIAK